MFIFMFIFIDAIHNTAQNSFPSYYSITTTKYMDVEEKYTKFRPHPRRCTGLEEQKKQNKQNI